MKFVKSHIPAIILILGAILRASTYGLSALWYDEAVTLWRSTSLPFMQLYSSNSDNSGCLLLDLLLRPLMAISHSLYLLRLPSLLAGLASLWLVWKLMQALLFTPRQQLIAALFAAFLPGLLWMGQDARTYSLLSLVFLGGLWFAVQGSSVRARYIVPLPGLTACMGLTIYCHNTGPAFAAALLAVAIYLRPSQFRRILISGFIAALAWLPALVHAYNLALIGFGDPQPWKPVLSLSWFVSSTIMAQWVTGNPVFVLSAFSLGILSLGLLYHRAWKNLQRNSLLIALLVPLAVLLVISLIHSNVILYRTLMPLLFPFALFLGWEFGWALDRDLPFPVYRLILAGGWLGALVIGLALWRPADRGGHLDQAAAYIRSQWRTGDVILYETQTVARPFLYYLPDLPHYNYTQLSSGFMTEPGVPYTDTGDPTTARRLWLVIPADALITPAEQACFDAIYPHPAAPLQTVNYLQAASIDVFLVEEK